jgi:hypothetical protein
MKRIFFYLIVFARGNSQTGSIMMGGGSQMNVKQYQSVIKAPATTLVNNFVLPTQY